MRLPVALKTAFATAAATPVTPISPNAVRAHRSVKVGDIRPDHLNLRNVHMNGYMVLSKTRVHDSAIAFVKLRLFHQRQAQTHNDAAAELACGSLCIQDATAIE